VIVLCGVEVATVTNDPFGRLLAVGVVVMVVAQALINIGMTLGLAPITGMTLPFVSFGGSSLWANFMALGLLVNIAQRRPMLIAKPPFEHRDE
jgi:cell division protein FtsW (lipid II flippase)